MDCSRVQLAASALQEWVDDEAIEALRNRFVTGDWEEGKKRSAARPGEESDDGSEGRC